MELLDGRKISAEVKENIKKRVDILKKEGIMPRLTALIVGDDPASRSYMKGIEKGCSEVGISFGMIELAENVSQEELEKRIEELNADRMVHGIILQLPLPEHLDALRAETTVSPLKDVDGTNPINTGMLLLGRETFFPSTPYGVVEILMRSGHDPEGKRVVICGRSNIVGKPLMGMLVQKRPGGNATVTVCHTKTKDLAAVTNEADILIAAIGRPKAITKDMVREGAVVIDVGVNSIKDPETGKRMLVGDVDFEAVKEKAGAITPVPGGVGPVTVTMLLANTVKACERQAQDRQLGGKNWLK
jgi:methylenetetrahydrofolate dehydrogenase (NADP+)/methenyltetrahydrofolate cyclohydrolase